MSAWRLGLLALAGTASFVAAVRLGGRHGVEDSDQVVDVAPREANRALPRREAGAAAPVTSSAEAPSAPVPAPASRWSVSALDTDIFAPHDWNPPPPPPPAPAAVAQQAPAAAAAPALPIVYVGGLQTAGEPPRAFLSLHDTLFIVGAGDVIEGAYRVDSLSATAIMFTYLPLDQQQQLALPGGVQ